MPGTILGTLNMLLISFLFSSYEVGTHYLCSTDEKTEATEKVRKLPIVTQPGLRSKQPGSDSLLEPLCYTAFLKYDNNS